MSYQGTSKQTFQTLSIKMQISNRISLNSPLQYFSIQQQPRSVDQVLKIYSQKRNSNKKKAQQSSYQSSTADSRHPSQISKKFQSIVLNQGVQSMELNEELQKKKYDAGNNFSFLHNKKASLNKAAYTYKPNRYQIELQQGNRRPRSSTNNKLNISSENGTKDSCIKESQMQYIRSVPSVQQSDDIETIKQEDLQQKILDLRSSQIQTQKLKTGSYTLTPDRLKRIQYRSRQNNSLNTSLIDSLFKDQILENRMKMIRSSLANYKAKSLYSTQDMKNSIQPQKEQLQIIKQKVSSIISVFQLREQNYVKKIKALIQENNYLKQEMGKQR